MSEISWTVIVAFALVLGLWPFSFYAYELKQNAYAIVGWACCVVFLVIWGLTHPEQLYVSLAVAIVGAHMVYTSARDKWFDSERSKGSGEARP